MRCRGGLHALELAEEDVAKWCGGLTDAELKLGPFGVAPMAFHLRHIARSLDRLLSYAEGRNLSDEQMGALKTEMERRRQRRCCGVPRRYASAEERVRRLLRRATRRFAELGEGSCRRRLAGCWSIARNTRRGMWGRR